MNWIDFLLYLTLLYVVYYAINVVIDVLRNPHNAAAKDGDSYSFQTDLSEFDDKPTVIEDNETEPEIKEKPTIDSSAAEERIKSENDSAKIEFKESNPVKSTGGVTNINSLFVLAKEGSIEMKRKVVFS